LVILLLGVGVATVRADWNSEISGANPVHWFGFEETSGTAADDKGSANIDGTYNGPVTLGTAGLVGNAATFDGTGHVFLGAPDLAADWTVEAIFKADTVTGGASMGLMGSDFTATPRMAIKADQWNKTGKLGYTVFGVVDVTLAADTPADFTHVAFVGTGSGVEVFVNGASAGSDAVATPLSRWILGAGAIQANGTLVDGLTGAIDELVIYDRALSSAEISSHFAAVPEPAAFSLMLLAMLGLCRLRR
jgi:hypothetical protein